MGILVGLCVLALPLVFFVTLVLGFATKRQPIRRNARVIASITGVTLIIVPFAIWLAFRLYFGPPPPSLTELQKSFAKQSADLQAIVQMSNQDKEYGRIAPDWVSRFPLVDNAGQSDYGAMSAPMPKVRWDAYRAIYRKNDIRLGVDRNRSGDIFIIVESVGLLNRGHASGYLYCNPEPRDSPESGTRFEPCTSQKTADEHRFVGAEEGYSFQKLADHWYAYDRGPS